MYKTPHNVILILCSPVYQSDRNILFTIISETDKNFKDMDSFYLYNWILIVMIKELGNFLILVYPVHILL